MLPGVRYSDLIQNLQDNFIMISKLNPNNLPMNRVSVVINPYFRNLTSEQGRRMFPSLYCMPVKVCSTRFLVIVLEVLL